jgi:Skp family chaperone for outer membrane proteins
MNSRMAVVAGVVVGLAGLLMPAGSAMAQSSAMPETKIAVCDPLKVLGQILEGKDASARWKAEGDSLNAEAQQKKDQLQSEADALKLIMPGSDEFESKVEKLTEDQANTQAWYQSAQMNLARKQRAEQKKLFDKILGGIKEVASAQGITVVINGSQPGFPEVEKMDANAFVETIMLHITLYADTHMDITGDVVIALDKEYKAGPATGAGAGAPPAIPTPTAGNSNPGTP